MNEQEKSKPMYDLTKDPLFDINDMKICYHIDIHFC